MTRNLGIRGTVVLSGIAAIPCVALVAATGGDALAGKPGGGGGGGGGGGNTTPPDIAYVVGNDLWVMQDDGTGQTRILNFRRGGVLGRPSWSPDGSQIAVAARDDDGTCALWVIARDGTGRRKVIDLDDPTAGKFVAWSPAPTPDGKFKIAYVDRLRYPDGSHRTSPDIFVVNLDGTGRQNVTDTETTYEGYPSWSPEGDQLAYDAATRLRTVALGVAADGSLAFAPFVQHYYVPSASSSGWAWAPRAEWTADGRRIDRFAYSELTGSPRLGDVFEIDIGDPVRDASGNPVSTNLTNSPSVEERHPSWSPDNSSLVYNAPNAIVRIDVATGATVVLSSQPDCGWAAWKRSVP